jgi:hypothetical protein
MFFETISFPISCEPPLVGVDFDQLWGQYPRKKDLFRSRNESAIQFLPETVKLVRELAPAYKMAVVSSSAGVEVEPVLEGSATLASALRARLDGFVRS